MSQESAEFDTGFMYIDTSIEMWTESGLYVYAEGCPSAREGEVRMRLGTKWRRLWPAKVTNRYHNIYPKGLEWIHNYFVSPTCKHFSGDMPLIAPSELLDIPRLNPIDTILRS